MKYAFVLTVWWCTVTIQQQRKEVCVVGFYNLENLYDTIDNPAVNDDEFTPKGAKRYNSRIYFDKLHKLAAVISGLGTDVSPDGSAILGVAEVENDTVLQDLVRHPLLRGRHYQVIHFDSRDIRGVDVGLLYQPAYFVPLRAEKLYVPLPGNSKEARFTRDILYVEGTLSGEPVHIYVNHWPSRRGGEVRSAPARAAAARVCRQHAEKISANDSLAKMILMGDLNDDPDSPSITRVLGAKAITTGLGTREWYNPWLHFYKKGIGTLAHRDSWGLFDQILLTGSWITGDDKGWRFVKAGIFTRDFMKEDRGNFKGYPMRTWDGNSYRGGYSDHFPTFVTLAREQRTRR